MTPAVSLLRRTLFRALINLAAVVPLTACHNPCSRPEGYADSPEPASAQVSDLTSAALAKADSTMALMTLEQKAAQCLMPSLLTDSSAPAMQRLADYIDNLDVGGILLLRGNLGAAAVMASRAAEAQVPLFMAIDAEWGLGMRLEDAPDFPRNGQLPAEVGEEAMFDYGREVARECRRVGISMVLGPVVDVEEDAAGFIGSRSFGADPRRVADLGVAYARGVESGGVVSVAKHFPGHGSPSADSHKTLPVVTRSRTELDSIDLCPFRSYIDAGLSGIMVGHLAVPSVDPSGKPAAVSEPVVRGLLRKQLGFRGLVLTDALNMGGAEGFGPTDALRAGADIIVGPPDTWEALDSLVAAVRSGRLDPLLVADRCRRILFHKYLLGLDHGSAPGLDSLGVDVTRGSGDIRRRLESKNSE